MQQLITLYPARNLMIFRNVKHQNRISEDQKQKINENFKIKHLTPPKFPSPLKFSNPKSSTSPPRFKQYSEFTSTTSRTQTDHSDTISKQSISSSRLLPIHRSLIAETSDKKTLEKISSSLLKSSVLKSRLNAKLIQNPSFLRFSKNSHLKAEIFKKSCASLPSIKKPFLKKVKKYSNIRKVRAALVHYKYLNLHNHHQSKLYEFFPGVAFGHPESREFLKACKSGNDLQVVKMLEANPWIAHSFDNSRVSAVHWAVIRGHLKIVELLVRSKVWLNVGDFVRIIQAGRTPIFLAAKYSNFHIFQYLINSGANPLIKTRAGTGIIQVTQDDKIRNAFNLYKAKKYYKVWLLGEMKP